MSTWLVGDASGHRGVIDAVAAARMQDGSILLLRGGTGEEPAELVAAFVMSRGAWTSAWIEGAVSWEDDPPPETVQEQDIPRAAPARILEQNTDIPDALLDRRRQVIADRLAEVTEQQP